MGLVKSLKNLGSNIGESLGFKGHDQIGNTVGQWMNNITGSSDMYNREYEGNVALWNMQNEYNTPAAQIARMKAAGINVNPLTYAVGNGNMSTSAGSISTPSVGASGINPIASLVSVMSGIQGVRAQRLQNELVKKDLEFYDRMGYRPGTGDWMTIIPGLVKEFGPKIKEFFNRPTNLVMDATGDRRLPEVDASYVSKARKEGLLSPETKIKRNGKYLYDNKGNVLRYKDISA